MLLLYVANLRRVLKLLVPQRGSVHSRGIAVSEAIERTLLLADLFGDFVEGDLWHSSGCVVVVAGYLCGDK